MDRELVKKEGTMEEGFRRVLIDKDSLAIRKIETIKYLIIVNDI